MILDPAKISYKDTSVKKGIIYYYYIVASNEFGESQPSRISVTLKELPTQPLNLTAIPGDKYILLKWQPPQNDGGSLIVEYKIYMGTIKGNESYLINVNGNITIFNNTHLTNDQTYYYKISAMNEVGEGLFSNEVNATPFDIHDDENNDNNGMKNGNNKSKDEEQASLLSYQWVIYFVIILISFILISIITYLVKIKK